MRHKGMRATARPATARRKEHRFDGGAGEIFEQHLVWWVTAFATLLGRARTARCTYPSLVRLRALSRMSVTFSAFRSREVYQPVVEVLSVRNCELRTVLNLLPQAVAVCSAETSEPRDKALAWYPNRASGCTSLSCPRARFDARTSGTDTSLPRRRPHASRRVLPFRWRRAERRPPPGSSPRRTTRRTEVQQER